MAWQNIMPLNHLKPPGGVIKVLWPLTAISIHHDSWLNLKLNICISLLIEIAWAGPAMKKQHRLHISLHPKPHLLQSCRERHSINMLNSIKSRPCTKLLTFEQVFTKSACKFQYPFSVLPFYFKKECFWIFLYVHKLSWAKKVRSPRSKMSKTS